VHVHIFFHLAEPAPCNKKYWIPCHGCDAGTVV
jgi:hypothetical protein